MEEEVHFYLGASVTSRHGKRCPAFQKPTLKVTGKIPHKRKGNRSSNGLGNSLPNGESNDLPPHATCRVWLCPARGLARPAEPPPVLGGGAGRDVRGKGGRATTTRPSFKP